MNLLLNILLAAGFIAFGRSACDVCKCDGTPPGFDREFFDAHLRDELPTETRYFEYIRNIQIFDCKISYECTFGLLGEGQKFVTAAVGTLGNSNGESLENVNCVNGSKWHSEKEGDIQYIGCYSSIPKSLE